MKPGSPVTVVTGAAGALAAAVIDDLVRRGHRVAAVDLPRASDRLRQIKTALPLAFDTDQPSEWTRAVEQVQTQLGPITSAILIAGGWQGGGPLHARTDDRIWDAMLAANLRSVYRALRALLPTMVGQKSGSIIVIGARVALRPETGAGAAEYTAMKSAVVALAQAVAAETLESGVRINAVLPSTLDTAANRAAMPNADPSRWVSPTSLAEVIAFLISNAARDVSGAAIPVYGRS